MVELTRSTKKLELDINVAKMGNSAFFHSKQQILQQTANCLAQHKNLHAAEHCWPYIYHRNDITDGWSGDLKT